MVCDHLGKAGDPDTYLAFPSAGNRCGRVDPPQMVALAHQARFCLKRKHTECPVFSPDWPGGFPDKLRPTHPRGRRRRRPLIIGGVVFAALAAAGLWFFGGADGALLSGATAPPVSGMLLPETWTPPVAVMETASPSPTIVPQPTTPPEIITPSPSLTPWPTAGPALETPFGPGEAFLIHQVRAGETLFFMARAFGSSVEAITAVNGLGDLPLWVDKLLVVPIGDVDVAGLPIFLVHQVAPDGSSVEEVAALYSVAVEELRRYNSLGEGPVLMPGRWLIVPVEK